MRLNSLRSPDEAAQVNARRRAKKELLWNKTKPKLKSDWVELSELLITWSKESDSISIDDFGVKYNYGPHRIAKWVNDSDEFKEAWEIATYNVLQRRNKAWRDPDKLLNRTIRLYDWRLRDDEDEQAQIKAEKKHIASSIPIELYQPLVNAIKDNNDKESK